MEVQVFGTRRCAHTRKALRFEALEEEPLLLETPLVRRGSDLTVGAAEEAWRGWTSG